MAKSDRSGPEEEFRKGDRVSWSSHGNETAGEVEEKITSDRGTAGRRVAASEEDPRYKVRSEKTGRSAIHRPESLHRGAIHHPEPLQGKNKKKGR